jgi:broad specificity phosphatase PhoE
MTRLYLVRHGQTEWNRQERFRGRIDIPLNDVGRSQAQAVATYLSDKSIVAVYSSPLLRSLDTARPVASIHGLTPVILPGIIDIDYGEWQSLTPDEARDTFPDLVELWYSAPHLVDIPGGENLKTVRARAMSAVRGVLSQHVSENIVLVTHQIVIKVVTCTLLDLEISHIWRIQQDNACVDIFEWDQEQFLAVLINGTDHLSRKGGLQFPG